MVAARKMLGKLGDMIAIDMKDAMAMLTFEIAVVGFGAGFEKTESGGAVGAEIFGENADLDKIVKDAIDSAAADTDVMASERSFDIFDSKRRRKTLNEREKSVAIGRMIFSLIFDFLGHRYKCNIWARK